MMVVKREPLQELVKEMLILEAMGKREEANKAREEIKQRLREAQGRGAW
jgi:predicted Holliday junction resolvase-like endonuclease